MNYAVEIISLIITGIIVLTVILRERVAVALLTFLGIFFALAVALALTETFTNTSIRPFGSRMSIFWIMLALAAAGAVVRWFYLSKNKPSPVTEAPSSPSITVAQERLRRVVLKARPHEDATVTRFLSTPEELDMAEEKDVAWVQAQRDPALWHQATIAALAYRGDHYGFLNWVLQQPETDRATAGWIFFWAEGARYLRGKTDFPLNHLRSDAMLDLFRAICDRSQGVGFTNDALGLDRDFEPERALCLSVIENGEVAAGIVPPVALLTKPFDRPRSDRRFMLDDGIILLANDYAKKP